MRATTVLDALATAETELDQVLGVLAAAGQSGPERLALGEGDRRLLAIHRELVGSDLELVVTCRSCGTVNSLLLAPEAVAPARPRVAALGTGGGLREPTYDDLIGLPADDQEAERELLRRCIVGTPTREPEPADLALVDDSLAGPLVTACAGCGEPVEARLDVERAVLEGLQRMADEAELEVHLLARAYHWDLEAIERLPDERRRRFAGFVEAGR